MIFAFFSALRSLSESMKFIGAPRCRRLLTFALGCVIVSHAAGTEAFRRPAIEAAQRALQERYVAWSTTARANGFNLNGFPDKVVWPALSNGKQPGDYPKDCFYDEELIDEQTGQVNFDLLYYLIADLVNKTVSHLPNDQFLDPNYLGRVAGLGDLPTLAPPVFPGSQVNPANYVEFFRVACEAIRNSSHPVIHIYSTGTTGGIGEGGLSPYGFGAIISYGSSCADATSRALAEWQAGTELPTHALLLGRMDRLTYTAAEGGAGSWEATFGNWRGRFGFAHSSFGTLGGSAQVFLYAFDPLRELYGTPATTPLSSGDAPVPEYYQLHLDADLSLAPGGLYFTGEFGAAASAFVSDCPDGGGVTSTNSYGYALDAWVVASPNFKEQIGSLVAACSSCAACTADGCPPGGTTSLNHGSIDYRIPLGSGRDGSAGSANIFSDTASFLMASPFGLDIQEVEGTTVLGDLTYGNIPRQIVVPQGLVDITVTEPFKRYVMKFYDLASRGQKVGAFYQPLDGAEYKTISVENPGLNARVISGTLNLPSNNYQIHAPSHGLSPGSYYVMRVDADSGALPSGWTIGRIDRRQLYYVYALDSSTLAFLYFSATGQAYLDPIRDAVPGQILKISSPFPYTNLAISEATESLNRSFNYTYTPQGSGSALSNVRETIGTRIRSSSLATSSADATHSTENQWVEDGGGHVITKTRREYQIFPWNRAQASSKIERETLVAEVQDPDGAALTTAYAYYVDASVDGPNYSRLKEVVHPSGEWERYEYDWDGRAIRTYSGYLDASPSFDAATCRVVEQSTAGATDVADLDGDGRAEDLATTVETTLGRETSRTYRLTWSAIDASGRQRVSHLRCLEPGVLWNDPSNARSETWTYVGGAFAGKPAMAIDEAGLLSVYRYGLDAITGQTTSEVVVGVGDAGEGTVTEGTKTVTVTNTVGELVDLVVSDVASGIVLRHDYTPAAYFDSVGRATRLYGLDGGFTQTIHEDCCGTTTTTDRAGTVTIRERDASGTVIEVVRGGITDRFAEGFAAESASGVNGFTRSTYRKARGADTELLVRVETFDPAGRLIATLDPRDGIERITRYTEGRNGAGRWFRSVTSPDGGVETTLMFQDGAVMELQQAGLARTRFQYGVESSAHDGRNFYARTTTQIRVADDDSGGEWVKEYVDPLGRSYRSDWPSPDGDATVNSALSFFDNKGRLIRQVDADSVQTLFSQDDLGQTRIEALDVNRNGEIDFAGSDRIRRTRRTLQTAEGKGDIARTVVEVWDQADNDSETTLSTTEEKTNGLESWISEGGLTTHVQLAYPGNGRVETTVERPDQTTESSTSLGGVTLDRKVSSPVEGILVQITNEIDGLDRVKTITDELTGGSTSFTYYENDLTRTQVVRESIGSTATQTTEFIYDSMGRLITTVQPDGSRAESRYFSSGAVRAQYGAGTFPTEYTSDRQGRLSSLTTWQEFNDAAGAGVSGAAVTTLQYNFCGWLRAKRDQSGRGPNYTYTPAGRLRTRESARTGADGSHPILTNYTYGAGGVGDSSVLSGDILGISYSNDPAETPRVENRYDRRGRLDLVRDGSGTRELRYDRDDLDTESYVSEAGAAAQPLAGYVLDRNFDALRRYGGITARQPDGASAYAVGYEHDAAGRLSQVSYDGRSVNYTYTPAGPTRIAMEYRSAGQPFLSVAQNFDGMNRSTSRINTAGARTKSVTYTHDALNRRETAASDDGSYWRFGYDPRNEVSSAIKHDAGDGVFEGMAFGYDYDDIGNRRTASRDQRATEYVSNLLNQYTALTIPRVVTVRGSADPAAAITVDGQPVSMRNDREFLAEIDVSSGVTPTPAHWREIAISGVLAGGGVNGGGRTATETREVWVPKGPNEFQYDADGNLLDDERWTYTWDAENRLVAIEAKPAPDAPEGLANVIERHRVEFVYDSSGRRVTKKVYNWDAGTATWTLARHLAFLYDGWNLLLELDQLAGGDPVSSYAWGSDLSGSFQGADGIGGLLFAKTPTGTYSPVYNGNGDVTGWVDASDGMMKAEHEYDAFGNVVSAPSAESVGIPFGFSTKYVDEETGLSYYGYRYYQPTLGRWLSRDPIGEDGGVNLYGFVENAPTNENDALGLSGYFFDGTGNNARSGTNVRILWEIYGNPLKFYYRGVGSSFGTRIIGGLTGAGGGNRLRSAYRDFIRAVDAGDHFIDIVGFSRGAALAREFANRLVERGYDPAFGGKSKTHRRVIKRSDSTPPRDCELILRFVGLFDSVGSFGWPGNNINIGIRMKLPAAVGFAAHATARDEKRYFFPLTPIDSRSGFESQSFPGDHSDVGRGHGRDSNDLSRSPLEYIWRSGRAAGVPFDDLPAFAPTGDNTPHDLSRRFPYNLFPKRPRIN